MHIPRIFKILEVVQETPSVKTFFLKALDIAKLSKPGNFVMVWIPRVDEKPMAVSYADPNSGLVSITVEKIGKATTILHSKKVGDVIGLRGPYGNHFKIIGEKLLVVGGGIGTAPLGLLVEQAILAGKKTTVIVGARTAKDLLFVRRFKKTGAKVIITTDDGSAGLKGLVTDAMTQLLSKERFDQIYACGPEPMLKKVFEISENHKIQLQASLSRYIKCGIGLCDSCEIDGFHLCTDGPIFNSALLRKMDSFGRYMRDASGKIIPI